MLKIFEKLIIARRLIVDTSLILQRIMSYEPVIFFSKFPTQINFFTLPVACEFEQLIVTYVCMILYQTSFTISSRLPLVM